MTLVRTVQHYFELFGQVRIAEEPTRDSSDPDGIFYLQNDGYLAGIRQSESRTVLIQLLCHWSDLVLSDLELQLPALLHAGLPEPTSNQYPRWIDR